MNRRFIVFLPIMLAAILGVTGCEFSVSTANIADAKLAKSVNDKMEAVDPTTTFSTTDSEVHAVVELANAPAETVVRGVWKSAAGEQLVDPTDVTAGGDKNNVHFSLRNANGLIAGDYKLEIYLNPLASDSAAAPEKVLTFSVK